MHSIHENAVDATLLNAPFRIARMTAGQRATHPLDLLSDWMIMTPAGRIHARSTRTLRAIRANKDQLLALVREEQGQQSA